MDPSAVQDPDCLQVDAVEWGEGDLPFPGSTGFLGILIKHLQIFTPRCLSHMFAGQSTFSGPFRGKTSPTRIYKPAEICTSAPLLSMFILETSWFTAKAQGLFLFIAVCLHWCVDEMVKPHCKEQSCAVQQYLDGIHISDKV